MIKIIIGILLSLFVLNCSADSSNVNTKVRDTVNLHNLSWLSYYTYKGDKRSIYDHHYIYIDLNSLLGNIIYQYGNTESIREWEIARKTRIYIFPVGFIGAISSLILFSNQSGSNGNAYGKAGGIICATTMAACFSLGLYSTISLNQAIIDLNISIKSH